MSNSNFIGSWRGRGVGAEFGDASIIIRKDGERLIAYGVGRTRSGKVEIFEFEGVLESVARANLSLLDYTTDDPRVNAPNHVRLVLDYLEGPERIEAQFVSDIGTFGTFTFRRVSRIQEISLIIPGCVQKAYRRLKYYFRQRARYFYLLLIVVATLLSVFGKIEKISIVEGLLLVFILPFLFIDYIQRVVVSLSLRKLGPVEFETQKGPMPHLDPYAFVSRLHDEFPENLALFLTFAKVFIPKTKALLMLLESEGKSLNNSELYSLAKGVGVPDSDFDATKTALIKSKCVEADESNRFQITNLGRNYLLFEHKMKSLSTGQ